uniref:Aldehyde oxidase n=1 Tax=candidate division WOR-3 bacterium TaxID=2052148 RepID=A0A7C4YAW6_UNCW3
MDNFINVKKQKRKIDAIGLATGFEKFTDDFSFPNMLHLKFLYSPHPFAEIIDIDTEDAEKMEGVEIVLTYKNTPDKLYTTAGQGFPEPSPYDKKLFDKYVRFVGDYVALVGARTLKIAEEAINKIKVEYKILKPVFDVEDAIKEDAPKIHREGHYLINAIYETERNISAGTEFRYGDVDKGFEDSDFVIEEEFSLPYENHCALEPHSAIAYLDERGRIVIISSTQVPFHARRIVSFLLDIPVNDIRVIKPRVGGGFGAKQEVILEPYVALVTYRTGKPSRLVLSREEVFVSTRTRHPAKIKMKMGFMKDGFINSLKMDVLMNAGAYGSHSLTVLSNVGSKVLPLFNKIPNILFTGKSVYTNLPVGGAYRGYGATQGYFAFGQMIDIITRKLNIDIIEYYKKWHIKEGETSPVFEKLGEGKEGVTQYINSCKLSECIDIGAREIDWFKKRGKRIRNGDKVRGLGMACAMQGSGIPLVDMASATMKMNDDGSFNLFVGATDIGTGSDTILTQIAGEVLKIPSENISILSSDTDLTPFDVGAYASSTTFVSGNAVRKCAENVKEQILNVASEILKDEKENLFLDNGYVFNKKGEKVSFKDIALYAFYKKNQFQIFGYASNVENVSPPPFIAQFVELDVDIKTGFVDIIKFVSVVDCGTPINPKLAEGQVEGAVLNAIAFALTEDYIFDKNGRLLTNNFNKYKVFNTKDKPDLKTIIVESYEKAGPFGAKSIAEIGMNGPAPAIANAIYDAVGVRIKELPITPEKIFKKLRYGF